MALTNISILYYNNYFNRIFKKPAGHDEDGEFFNSISDYTSATTYHEEYTNFNFWKRDNVNAELVVNTYKEGCDYVVEYDDYNVVLSRWFIVESMNVRNGQYRLTLRRDLLADFYDSIINAPAYIEKGWPKTNDVAIYNQEQLALNEIKKSEDLLYDHSSRAYIVGYYTNLDAAKTVSFTPQVVPDYTFVDESEFRTYFGLDSNNKYKYRTLKDFELKSVLAPSFFINNVCFFHLNKGTYNLYSQTTPTNVAIRLTNVPTGSQRDTYLEVLTRGFLAGYKSLLPSSYDNAAKDFHFLNNKIVKIGNDYKKITLVTTTSADTTESYPSTSASYTALTSFLTSIGVTYTAETGSFDYKTTYIETESTITLSTFTPEASISAVFPLTTNHLNDAPYNMFVIPYTDNLFTSINGTSTMTQLGKETIKQFAVEIAKEFGSFLVDLQLLPYCPCQEYIDESNPWPNLDIDGTINVDYIPIKNNSDTVVEAIFFPKTSQFTFDINRTLTVNETVEDLKTANQCEKYRLCSPNFASVFEFNVVKTGNITKFNVDCTYKPYNPYIKVNPVWSNLYGSDFDDYRGLICQGEFSLAILTDQWKQYQINNKNYLNAFNRQIESIELNQKYQRIGDIINASTGALTGAAVGAMAGPVGAVAGGVASAGGGIADVFINEKLRRDSLDLTKDQFNYSIDNIKALPNTVAKISTFDKNNKIVPVLEYYSCTDQEKEIFKDKIIYNGCTIMRIDKIKNFITGNKKYCKGQIIRMEELMDDFHIANEIANEFNKGWYI